MDVHVRVQLQVITVLLSTTAATATSRCLLHQPFFSGTSSPPVNYQFFFPSPISSPLPQTHSHRQPKSPSSFTPFFPSLPTPPPSSLSTFPANISSFLLPPSHSPPSHRRLLISLSASLLSAALLLSVIALFLVLRNYRGPAKAPPTDSLPLFPPSTTPSDVYPKPSPSPPQPRSLGLLYLGTIVNSAVDQEVATQLRNPSIKIGVSSSPHQNRSPELNPLPPLPRVQTESQIGEQFITQSGGGDGDEEFFSPRGSSGQKELPPPPPPLPRPQISELRLERKTMSETLKTSKEMDEKKGVRMSEENLIPKLKPLHQ